MAAQRTLQDSAAVIEHLGLRPHPEGGWYAETWRDPDGHSSAIYYLLAGDEPSAWHRVAGRSEIWHFYAGSALILETGDGPPQTLGGDIAGGARPQVRIEPGVWQRARSTGAWTLVGCTVSPAFDFAAFELAPPGWNPGGDAPAGSTVAAMVTPPPDGVIPLHPTPAPHTAGSHTAGSHTAGSHTAVSHTAGSHTAGSHTAVSHNAVSHNAVSHNTLAIDVGGTGLKASVVDDSGQLEHDRVRVDTPYPLPPEKLVTVLTDLVKALPDYDRVSVGFPGMVRAGRVLSAPHFISPKGPGGEPTPKLVKAWDRFNLQIAISHALGKPTRVANDADIQGAAVVRGQGLELVITLGTGVGTALFYEGRLLPHLELAHHPLRKELTYNEVLGDAARKHEGSKKWNRRVVETVEVLRALTFFDHCYIGGGNSARVEVELPDDVTLVDNSAGITGGVKLWALTA